MSPLQTGIDDWEAIEVIGMGSWRLADRVSQPFDALVAHVEGMWRHQLPMDLRLYPLAEVLAWGVLAFHMLSLLLYQCGAVVPGGDSHRLSGVACMA